MTTRHQRRKLAKQRALSRSRQEIVRGNLSKPADRFVPRGSLVSGVYRGEGGRARGMGVVPMTHKVTAVILRRGSRLAGTYPAGVRIIERD